MPSSLNILAIDTALGACSAAILSGGEIKAGQFKLLHRGHAEALMDMIGAVEEEAGLRLLDMDRLAVTIGPGTFTGLRVGLSAARGMALAARCPLVGVTTLQAVAFAACSRTRPTDASIAAIFDARKDEVYFQMFSNNATPLNEARVLSRDRVAEEIGRQAEKTGSAVTLVGTGAQLVADILPTDFYGVSDAPMQPNARIVAALANIVEDVKTAPPNPLYLRPPDAKLPAKSPLQQ